MRITRNNSITFRVSHKSSKIDSNLENWNFNKLDFLFIKLNFVDSSLKFDWELIILQLLNRIS